MSPYRRNVMVGATVLGALVVLIWMILKFGGDVMKPFAPKSIAIKLTTPRADGIAIGSQVYYRGVVSGKVISIRRLDNNLQVEITAEVESEPALPSNIEAQIRIANLLGGNAGIYLELINDAPPAGELQKDQQIPSSYVGLDLLPREFTELATELRRLSLQFREANVVGNLSTQIDKVGTMLDSVQSVIGDKKLQADLKAAVADFRTAAQKAVTVVDNAEKFSAGLPDLQKQAAGTIDKTQQHIDDLAKKVGDRLTQAAATLDHLQSIMNKIDKGEGSVGKLINDPKLYQNLIETTDQLSVGAADLRRLLEQWEQEGVSLKLK